MGSEGQVIMQISGIRLASAVATMIAAGTLSSAAVAAPVTIDDFLTGGTSITIGSGVGTSFSIGAASSIIGTERDVRLEVVDPGAGSNSTIAIGLGTFDYNHSNPEAGGTSHSRFLLQYDGVDGAIAGAGSTAEGFGGAGNAQGLTDGAGGVDLTGGGMFDAFGTLFTLDSETVFSEIRLYDGGGRTVQHLFDKVGPVTDFQHFAFFNDSGAANAFTLIAGAGAFDFTDITSIEIMGEAFGDNTVSPTIGGLTLNVSLINGISVPEPTTVALFGAGLVGLGAVRRRRKTAA
jgi:hypothetical protein